MELLKRLFFILLVILFLMSIHKDLTTGTIVQEISNPQPKQQPKQHEQISGEQPDSEIDQARHPKETDRYQVVSQVTQNGDTVLSIVESLNNNQSSIQMNQIIQDFKVLNPEIDPHKIQPNEPYLFPVYKNLP